jgi:hypothetical protein
MTRCVMRGVRRMYDEDGFPIEQHVLFVRRVAARGNCFPHGHTMALSSGPVRRLKTASKPEPFPAPSCGGPPTTLPSSQSVQSYPKQGRSTERRSCALQNHLSRWTRTRFRWVHRTQHLRATPLSCLAVVRDARDARVPAAFEFPEILRVIRGVHRA